MPTQLDYPSTIPADWTPAEWETLIAALTRRKLLGGGLALGALSVLAACGGSPATATAPTTRQVDTPRGKVTIPVNPQRVVAVINYAMHDLFDIGFNPIGIPDGFASAVLPEFSALYQKTEKVGHWNQLDLEKIAALKPDLILGIDSDLNAPLYDRLKAIAPTALFSLVGTSDWTKVAAEFADAVGRTSQFATLKKQYQDRAAALRATYADQLKGRPWAIVTAPVGKWVLWYPDSSAGQVLGDIGVQFVGAAAGKTGNYKEFSYEQLETIADAAVIVTSGTKENVSAGIKAMMDQATFKALNATKAGHVYPLPQLFPYSYKVAMALLDQAEEVLRQLK